LAFPVDHQQIYEHWQLAFPVDLAMKYHHSNLQWFTNFAMLHQCSLWPDTLERRLLGTFFTSSSRELLAHLDAESIDPSFPMFDAECP
jgi:hypothetical protein